MKDFVLNLDNRYRITRIVWDAPTEYKELSFNLVDTPGIATKIDYEDFVKSGMKENKAKKRAQALYSSIFLTNSSNSPVPTVTNIIFLFILS